MGKHLVYVEAVQVGWSSSERTGSTVPRLLKPFFSLRLLQMQHC